MARSGGRGHHLGLPVDGTWRPLAQALGGTLGRHPGLLYPPVRRCTPTSPPRPVIARVEPLTRTRAVRGPFDYRLRPDQADVGVGPLLRVPFGHRTALGVVLELAPESELEPDRLAEPDAVLPPGVAARTWSSWPAGSPSSTARRPHARSGWCSRPDAAGGRGRKRGAGRRPDRGRGATRSARRQPAHRPPAVRRSSGSSAKDPPPAAGARQCHAAPPRGPRPRRGSRRWTRRTGAGGGGRRSQRSTSAPALTARTQDDALRPSAGRARARWQRAGRETRSCSTA